MNQMQQVEIPLHDIKPLLEIQEYSLYYFLAVVGVILIIAAGLLYLLYRYFKHKNAFNIRKEHYKNLQNLNLHQDTKEAAYALTRYGATFAEDSPRHQKHYELMLERLENYKYKKNVGEFDDETLRTIENYLGMIDV